MFASSLRLVARQPALRPAVRLNLNKNSFRAASAWSTVPQGPPAILGITEAFKADKSDQKINLGVGAYRDDQGKPYVLPSVREAERRVVERKLNKEYAGITGVPEFTKAAARLAYGADSPALDRIAIAQSISGTGALRIGAAFIQRFYSGDKKIFIPTPSWANHKAVFSDAGLNVQTYRYYKKETNGLDFDGLVEDLKKAPMGSVFLFHACAHNPTGIDPTPEQWQEIVKTVKEQGHFPFIDMAYQGFSSGSLEKDSYALRLFVKEGLQPLLTQSFAKNMGLYGERVGTVSLVCADAAEAKRVDSQLKIIIRPMYSNPPVGGARVASEILNDTELYNKWLQELEGMAGRIQKMRDLLKDNLEKLGSKRDWSSLTSQQGMFAYTGLTADQMKRLANEFHIYATLDGRISVSGITSSNVEHLAKGMHEVTK